MKTKTKLITKLLAVFAVTFLCLGVATISLTGQSAAIAADNAATNKPVYNFYNVEDRSCLNGNYGVQSTDSSKYITDYLETDETYGYILTLTCNTTMSGVGLRNTEVKFVKGVTYNISFYAMCEKFTTNSSWYVYPTVLKNGSIVKNFDNSKAQGNLTTWTKKSYSYTANGEENELRLVVNMQAGDIIKLRNIEMSLPADQFDGKINLAPSEGFSQRGGVPFEKSTVEDSVYGNVTKFTAAQLSGNNSVFYFKNTMVWKEGAIYDIIFRVKTSADANVNCYLQAKVIGKQDTVIVDKVLTGKEQTSWKTYYARFKYEDMFKTDNVSSTAKDIFLIFTAANADAEIYMTDIEVYADLSKVTIKKTNETKYDYLDYVVKGGDYTLPSIVYENDNLPNNVTPIGWDYLGTLYKGGDKINNVSENIVIQRVLIEYSTESGAWLRLDNEHPGIRFIADVNKNDVESVLKKYYAFENIEFGMRITSVDKQGYLEIKAENWQSETRFTGVVSGFNQEKEEFYNIRFTATAYVKLSGQDNLTFYANSSATDKSVAQMAKAALNDYGAGSSEYTILSDFAKYATAENEA